MNKQMAEGQEQEVQKECDLEEEILTPPDSARESQDQTSRRGRQEKLRSDVPSPGATRTDPPSAPTVSPLSLKRVSRRALNISVGK